MPLIIDAVQDAGLPEQASASCDSNRVDVNYYWVVHSRPAPLGPETRLEKRA